MAFAVLCTGPVKAVEDQRSKADTTRQVIAWRIYYNDSTRVRLVDSLGWLLAPTTGVVAVEEIYIEAYRYWYEVRDTLTQTIRGRWQLRNYRQLLYRKDFYWRVFPKGYLRGGVLSDIPSGLPAGTVKTGVAATDTNLQRVYGWAWEDREREVDSLAAALQRER